MTETTKPKKTTKKTATTDKKTEKALIGKNTVLTLVIDKATQLQPTKKH